MEENMDNEWTIEQKLELLKVINQIEKSIAEIPNEILMKTIIDSASRP
jgi:hypothetical protein